MFFSPRLLPLSPAAPSHPPGAKLPFTLFSAISVLGNTEPLRFECLSGSYADGAAEAVFQKLTTL